MDAKLKKILFRLDTWRGAPANGLPEEDYCELICAVSDDLAEVLGVPLEDREVLISPDHIKDREIKIRVLIGEI